jgi:L-ascorbate metabolism protein UlaG (beta-lactamase superfamily)
MKETGIRIAVLFLGAALSLAIASSAAQASRALDCGQDKAVLLAQGEDDLDTSDELRGDHPYDVRDREPVTPPQQQPEPGTPAATPDDLLKGIRWLGHASFLIQNGRNIYLDPFRLGEGLPPADIVLITHDHSDHLSPDDLAQIVTESTTIVSIAAARDKLPKKVAFVPVKAGDTLTVQGIHIQVVPAYNIKEQFHPKKLGYVGFIIDAGGRTIYDAGDTDFIPEMKNIKADVALLPVGGTYTMDGAEAAEAANAIKPRVAIPMHYGTIVGTEKDAQTFKSKAKVPVVIMKPEPGEAETDRQQ